MSLVQMSLKFLGMGGMSFVVCYHLNLQLKTVKANLLHIVIWKTGCQSNCF